MVRTRGTVSSRGRGRAELLAEVVLIMRHQLRVVVKMLHLSQKFMLERSKSL